MLKSLKDLIEELNKIPNPEKVGIATYAGDGYFDLMPAVQIKVKSLKEITLNMDGEKNDARKQGIENVILF